MNQYDESSQNLSAEKIEQALYMGEDVSYYSEMEPSFFGALGGNALCATYIGQSKALLRKKVPELAGQSLICQQFQWPLETVASYLLLEGLGLKRQAELEPEFRKVCKVIEENHLFDDWELDPIGDMSVRQDYSWSEEDEPMISKDKNIIFLGPIVLQGVIKLSKKGCNSALYFTSVSLMQIDGLQEVPNAYIIFTREDKDLMGEFEKLCIQIEKILRGMEEPNDHIFVCNDDLTLPLDTDCTWDRIVMTKRVKKNVFEDFKFFIEKADWFNRNGLPLKRGYLLIGPPGNGKCLGKGTPVLMYDGTIKKVEDVKVGDRLMGPDSSPRSVLSLARGREEMFKVIPNKGDPYIVNRSHILSLVMSDDAAGYKKGEVVNISVNDYLEMSNNFKHHAKGYRVAVDYPYQSVEVDPYYLGLWLGDGTATSTEITTEDPEIVSYLREIAESYDVNINDLGSCNSGNAHKYTLTTKEPGQKGSNRLRNSLRNIGVLGNKHIPHDYLVNDEETRLELLAGLLDADSSLAYKCHYFVTKYEHLADQVLYLARSLGFAAYKKLTEKTCTNSNNPQPKTYWLVTLSGHLDRIPHRINRKCSKERSEKKDVLRTGITLESIGEDDYYGFSITGDRLFLLGDFTVTHNTMLTRAMATTPGFRAFTFDFGNPRTSTNYHLQMAFQRASKNAPSVFLLEDVDRVFEDSDGDSSGSISKDALLACLDGISSNKGVVVVATANHPELIDEALLHRPGRFDRVVKIPNPDTGMREQFLKVTFDKCSDAEITDEAIKKVSDDTKGCSMAFLKEIFVASAGCCFSAGEEKIQDKHLYEATKIIMSQYKKTGQREIGL